MMRSCPRLRVFLLLALASAPGSAALCQSSVAAGEFTPAAAAARGFALPEAADGFEHPFGRRPAADPGAIFFLGDHRYEAGSGTVSIAAGRFDADTRLDLVTANNGGQSVTVLLQRRDGTFVPHAETPLGTVPVKVVAGDVNGDGFDDIAMVLPEISALVVLLCDGAGGFIEEARYATGELPWDLVMADLDGDGNTDIACANASSSTVSVFRNRGPGLPGQRFQTQIAYPVGEEPRALLAGDFTGDGLLDLATANATGHSISVLPGLGAGVMGSVVTSPLAVKPGSFAGADLDGDGDRDLVVSQFGHGVLLANDGHGRFAQGESLVGFGGGPGITIADLDGDGSDEILQVLGTTYGFRESDFAHVAVFRLTGSGFVLDQSHAVGAAPGQLIAADLEGDGDMDVVTVHSWGDKPTHERRDVSVIENLGRGRLASVTMRIFADWSTVPSRDYPTRLFALPRPGRRLPDLLMATTRGAQRFDNLGDGRFADPVRVMDFQPTELRDLTGDGILDAISAPYFWGDDTIRVFVGDASGAFSLTHQEVGYPYRASVKTRLHGLPDLLVWRYPPDQTDDGPTTVSVLPNLGGGRFGSPRLLEGVLYGPDDRGFLGSDLDGDGIDELLVARWGERRADSLLVFESQRRRGYRLAAALPLELDPNVGSDAAIPRQILTRPLERGRGAEIVVWSWNYGGGGSRLRLVHRAPDGTYRLLASMTGAGEEANDVAFDDFDGDDRGDVLIGEAESLGDGPLIGFRGVDDGGLERLPRWFLGVPTSGLASADFDGDRLPDLALVTGRAMSLHFFRNARAKRMQNPIRSVAGRPGTAPLASTVLRSNSARVEFVMSRDGAASVAVYDVTGRRLVSRDLGRRAAGVHAVELPEVARLAPGIYWLRAGERGAGVGRKVVVVR